MYRMKFVVSIGDPRSRQFVVIMEANCHQDASAAIGAAEKYLREVMANSLIKSIELRSMRVKKQQPGAPK